MAMIFSIGSFTKTVNPINHDSVVISNDRYANHRFSTFRYEQERTSMIWILFAKATNGQYSLVCESESDEFFNVLFSEYRKTAVANSMSKLITFQKKKKKKKKRHQLLPTYFEHQLSDKHQLHARRSTDEESVSTLIRLIGTSREHVEQHTIDHTRNKGVTDR